MSDALSRPGLAFVVNPVSGTRTGRQIADQLIARLSDRAIRDTETRPGNDGPRQVEFCGDDDCVLFGGDGTANKFVNALGPSRMPLAFFGVGTINVLSRALGIPRTIEGFTEMLQNRHLVDVPVGRVSGGPRFLMFYEIGFMGRIVCRVNAWRDRRGSHSKLPFVAFTITELLKWWPRRYTVTVIRGEAETAHGPFSNVLVTRVREYAGAMPMPIASSIETPILEKPFQVVGYRTRWLPAVLVVLICAATRMLPIMTPLLRVLGFMETFRAEEIRIDGENLKNVCQVDAESLAADLPHDIGIEEDPLPMFVPRVGGERDGA